MSKSDKIVHICNLDKFIPPFIDFIEEHFDDFETRHVFWVRGDSEKYPYRPRKNIINAPIGRFRRMYSYIKAVNSADKIILHGLFHANQIGLLSVMPWLHKKCYWVIWGGDLYSRKLAKRTLRWRVHEVFRRWLIGRIGHLVTQVRGDAEFARSWYRANGKWHECFVYTSNLYNESPSTRVAKDTINILVGNSADPSNNHLEIIERLSKFKSENIHVYAPLSYGNPLHAQYVARFGREALNQKFTALTDFMSLDDYLSFLSSIDIAVFNHKRQQAMGNTTTLLGMGRKVFMRSDVTSFDALSRLGVKVFDIDVLDISRIEPHIASRNIEVISAYFSKQNLVKQLRGIFN